MNNQIQETVAIFQVVVTEFHVDQINVQQDLVCLVSLFKNIATFVGYLMQKPPLEKNSSGAI